MKNPSDERVPRKVFLSISARGEFHIAGKAKHKNLVTTATARVRRINKNIRVSVIQRLAQMSSFDAMHVRRMVIFIFSSFHFVFLFFWRVTSSSQVTRLGVVGVIVNRRQLANRILYGLFFLFLLGCLAKAPSGTIHQMLLSN